MKTTNSKPRQGGIWNELFRIVLCAIIIACMIGSSKFPEPLSEVCGFVLLDLGVGIIIFVAINSFRTKTSNKE